MNHFIFVLAAGLVVGLCTIQPVFGTESEQIRELRNGRLYVDGEHVFLKSGKPLRNFSDADQCAQLIKDLPLLEAKHFNAVSINCYWHHFDRTGDGTIDVSLEPLQALLAAIAERGMYPILSIESYGVGGGSLPSDFWEKHPDAVAVNGTGKPVSDTEYGFGSTVPSLFSPDYLRASRAFIRNLVSSLDTSHILFFETTVEPQYIGNQAVCYSKHARNAYLAWRQDNDLANAPDWPETFPVDDSFLQDPLWNRFRAEALADWVNGDAAAFREAADNEDAWIAVDYLETGGMEMYRRNGDSLTFLRHLDADIIQVNWHWHLGTRAPNYVAYDNVRAVMKEMERDWVITEHMTLNGSDFKPDEVPAILRNALRQGTCFAWEFTNIGASSNDPFCLYDDAWQPKALMEVVDENWEQWMKEMRRKRGLLRNVLGCS